MIRIVPLVGLAVINVLTKISVLHAMLNSIKIKINAFVKQELS